MCTWLTPHHAWCPPMHQSMLCGANYCGSEWCSGCLSSCLHWTSTSIGQLDVYCYKHDYVGSSFVQWQW
jgi:hypothetical protein